MKKAMRLLTLLFILTAVLSLFAMPALAARRNITSPSGALVSGTADVNWQRGDTSGGNGSGEKGKTDDENNIVILGETMTENSDWIFWHILAPQSSGKKITVEFITPGDVSITLTDISPYHNSNHYGVVTPKGWALGDAWIQEVSVFPKLNLSHVEIFKLGSSKPYLYRGELTVRKLQDGVPAFSEGDYTIRVTRTDGGEHFDIKLNAATQWNFTTTLKAGKYIIEEIAGGTTRGYTLSISVDGSAGELLVGDEFEISDDEHVIIEVDNIDEDLDDPLDPEFEAIVRIVKKVNGKTPADKSVYTVNLIPVDGAGEPTGDDEIPFILKPGNSWSSISKVPVGDYKISEDAVDFAYFEVDGVTPETPEDYILNVTGDTSPVVRMITVYNGNGGDDGPGGGGEEETDKDASVTVKKTLSGGTPDDEDYFTVTLTSTKVGGDIYKFYLEADDWESTMEIPPGTYTVSEILDESSSGYAFDSFSISGSGVVRSGDRITISNNAVFRITLNNIPIDEDQAIVHIYKEITEDGEYPKSGSFRVEIKRGATVVKTLDLNIDNSWSASAVLESGVEYTISETRILTGYKFDSFIVNGVKSELKTYSFIISEREVDIDFEIIVNNAKVAVNPDDGDGDGDGGGGGGGEPPKEEEKEDDDDEDDIIEGDGDGDDDGDSDGDGGRNPIVIPEDYEPGGKDPDVAPLPTVFGNTLVPDGDGFIEFDEYDVPLGRWDYDDDEGEWIYDEFPPLGNLPRTGNDGAPLYMFIPAALLIALGLTLRRNDKKEKYDQE